MVLTFYAVISVVVDINATYSYTQGREALIILYMKNFDSEGHAEHMQTEDEEKTAHLRPLDCLTQVLLPLTALEETLQRAAGLPVVIEGTQFGTVGDTDQF